MTNTDVVRACFSSYLTQDRDAAESLIADDRIPGWPIAPSERRSPVRCRFLT